MGTCNKAFLVLGLALVVVLVISSEVSARDLAKAHHNEVAKESTNGVEKGKWVGADYDGDDGGGDDDNGGDGSGGDDDNGGDGSGGDDDNGGGGSGGDDDNGGGGSGGDDDNGGDGGGGDDDNGGDGSFTATSSCYPYGRCCPPLTTISIRGTCPCCRPPGRRRPPAKAAARQTQAQPHN